MEMSYGQRKPWIIECSVHQLMLGKWSYEVVYRTPFCAMQVHRTEEAMNSKSEHMFVSIMVSWPIQHKISIHPLDLETELGSNSYYMYVLTFSS